MKPNLTPEQYAQQIHQDFCEGDGGQCYHPLQQAWDRYQAIHGEIENGDEIDDLVYGAIHSAIQAFMIQLENEQK